MDQVRTRFAPSPTGSLHLGNLRIAIFNHLFARHHGGTFVLRVEDTDLERNVAGSLEGIMEDLRWAGLDWDEGPDRGGPVGPYRQSERGDLYRQAAGRLEELGLAYRCFCSDEAIAEARDGAGETGCPGRCEDLSTDDVEARKLEGREGALRFSVPDGEVLFLDEVRGPIKLKGSDIGDFIILRKDGRATYNFAVVVDDIAMKISHVIRGAGHLSNTPKQALLFDAMDAPRPVFAHLPMVLGSDRRKLSKREGARGVQELRTRGYHPDGVVNYLSLLGWSAGENREILSRDELVEAMDLSRVGAADTVFDPEKLLWASSQHIARCPLDELVEELRPWIDATRYPVDDINLPGAIDAIRTRLQVYDEVNEHLALVVPSEEVLQAGRSELAQEADVARTLTTVRRGIENVDPWEAEGLGQAVREAGKAAGIRGRQLFHPVRLAITGSRTGPDLGQVLAAQGRNRALRLLDRAIAGS